MANLSEFTPRPYIVHLRNGPVYYCEKFTRLAPENGQAGMWYQLEGVSLQDTGHFTFPDDESRRDYYEANGNFAFLMVREADVLTFGVTVEDETEALTEAV